MPSLLEKSRLAAFRRQGGRCFYCGLPVWLYDLEAFRARYPLSAKQVASRRCTAEHLLPKEDGGKDGADNIVAACALCNSRRHKREHARSPEEHRRHVLSRVRRGKWLPGVMTAALASSTPRETQVAEGRSR